MTSILCPALPGGPYVLDETITDPRNNKFCTDAVIPGACIDPSVAHPETCTAGITVSVYNADNCQTHVLSRLQDPTFRSAFVAASGCPVTTGTNGWTTSCEFGTDQPTFTGGGNVTALGFLIDETQFHYVCSQTEWDHNYYSICCNSNQALGIGTLSNGQTQTDPLTGEPFNPRSCAPEWCIADPTGTCSAIFEGCTGTSSCNRHWFLTNSPRPGTSDLELNTLVVPRPPETPVLSGIDCYNWYQETSLQAAQRLLVSPAESLVIGARVVAVEANVGGFCGDPTYSGNGECACINGYNQIGAQFGATQTAEQWTPTTTVPYMVQQDGTGRWRRLDAFCNFQGGAGPETNTFAYSFTVNSWTSALTRTINGTAYSYSNVCSNTAGFSPGEYGLPSANPMNHFASFTNFGFMNFYPGAALSAVLGDTEPQIPMPLHCWLPACVGADPAQPDTSVFRDLFQYTITCPNMCYEYSQGDSIDINNVNNAYVHIHPNYINCSGVQGYTWSGVPFVLPTACGGATGVNSYDIQMPSGVSSTINIPIVFQTFELSSQILDTTFTAYSDAFPLVAVYNSTKSAFDGQSAPEVIQKYVTYSEPSDPASPVPPVPQPQSYTLQIQVDSTGQRYNAFLTTVTLVNQLQEPMYIAMKISVFGPEGSAGTPSLTCLPCDPSFADCALNPRPGCNPSCPAPPPPAAPASSLVLGTSSVGAFAVPSRAAAGGTTRMGSAEIRRYGGAGRV